MRQGINIESSAQREILREIIEKYCYIALDPQNINPAIKRDKQDYALPDGTTIMIDNESMYLSPEVLFEPSMLGYNLSLNKNALHDFYNTHYAQF